MAALGLPKYWSIRHAVLSCHTEWFPGKGGGGYGITENQQRLRYHPGLCCADFACLSLPTRPRTGGSPPPSFLLYVHGHVCCVFTLPPTLPHLLLPRLSPCRAPSWPGLHWRFAFPLLWAKLATAPPPKFYPTVTALNRFANSRVPCSHCPCHPHICPPLTLPPPLHGGADSAGPRTPTTPPPPREALGQQLVAKGAALRSQWAPDAPWVPKAPEGKICPFCTLSLNTTLTLTPTLVLHLTLPIALIKTEYWDRAGGGWNISYDW